MSAPPAPPVRAMDMDSGRGYSVEYWLGSLEKNQECQECCAPMRYVSVTNSTTGAQLASHAAVAESFLARFLGLQFRRTFPPGAGLVLLPSSSIHMLFMFMRIDAIFVSSENVVIRVAHRLRPWTIGPIVPDALYCIELPEGSAQGTEAGHTIELAQIAFM